MLPWTLFLKKKKLLLGEWPAGNGLGQDEKAEQSCGVTGMWWTKGHLGRKTPSDVKPCFTHSVITYKSLSAATSPHLLLQWKKTYDYMYFHTHTFTVCTGFPKVAFQTPLNSAPSSPGSITCLFEVKTLPFNLSCGISGTWEHKCALIALHSFICHPHLLCPWARSPLKLKPGSPFPVWVSLHALLSPALALGPAL